MKEAEKARQHSPHIDELESLRQRVAELEREQTDRKIVEEALRESEERFRFIYENLEDGLLLADKETKKLLMGNPAILEMLGYSAEELNDLRIADIHPEGALPEVMNRFEELARREIRVARDIPVRRKCGSVFHADISSSSSIVFNRKECLLGVFRDITERRRAEEALQHSRQMLQNVLDNFPGVVFWKDPNSVYQGCNRAFARAAGFREPHEITGKTDYDLPWTPSEAEAYRKMDQEVMQSGVPRLHIEESQHEADGRVGWYETSKVPLFDVKGNMIGILGVSGDITERRRMEEELRRAYDKLELRVRERTAELELAVGALKAEIVRRRQTEEAQREAEKKYRSLFENAREGIYQSTPEGRYFTVNPAMARVYGYASPEEMITAIDSIDHQIFVLPDKRQELKRILATKGEVIDFEVEQRRKDGSTFWASLNVHAMHGKDGNILYWEGRSVDITERKRAEAALRRSEELLRLLSSRLLEAQEEERKRIARELHDSIGQSLAAIKFNVENVLEDKGKSLNRRALTSLRQIVPLVQNSMEEVRRIYTGLRPSMLDDLGIIATIGWFCRDFQKTYERICVKQQLEIEESDIPEPLKTVIFRIVQEALNNIAKHSGADSVALRLVRTVGHVELAMADNGTGFDVDMALARSSQEKGVGIAGMKERTELSGGIFRIESVIGEGSTIHAVWPAQEHLSQETN